MIALNTLLASDLETMPLAAIVDTALCVGAGGSSGSLADKAIVRTASGQLVIPGSHLKGRLRHECEKIAAALGWEIFYAPKAAALSPDPDPADGVNFPAFYCVEGYRGWHCPVSQIFGDPFLPSRIFVDDLLCTSDREVLPDVLRPGVSLNRKRRTAEDSKLFFLETSPVAAGLMFAGSIAIQREAPPWTRPLLLAGLRHITHLGGSKSSGLGWIHWENLATLSPDDPSWKELEEAVWRR